MKFRPHSQNCLVRVARPTHVEIIKKSGFGRRAVGILVFSYRHPAILNFCKLRNLVSQNFFRETRGDIEVWNLEFQYDRSKYVI